MKIIIIGRSSSNDIQVNDISVSRVHCQIVQDDNGFYKLTDLHSRNGTYVNGSKIDGSIRLRRTDVVQIGNTILPWQEYFPSVRNSDFETSETSVSYARSPIPSPSPQPPSFPSPSSNQPSGLGTIALVVSIAGAALLIYCAILIMKWGFLALIGSASTYTWVSFCLSILALILASIANYKDYKDSDAADIAEAIAGLCITVIVGFILYWKYGDPNLLNPFK